VITSAMSGSRPTAGFGTSCFKYSCFAAIELDVVGIFRKYLTTVNF
jgi:hypothetical protein